MWQLDAKIKKKKYIKIYCSRFLPSGGVAIHFLNRNWAKGVHHYATTFDRTATLILSQWNAVSWKISTRNNRIQIMVSFAMQMGYSRCFLAPPLSVVYIVTSWCYQQQWCWLLTMRQPFAACMGGRTDMCGPDHSFLYWYEYVHWRVLWPRMASGYIILNYEYFYLWCQSWRKLSGYVFLHLAGILHKSSGFGIFAEISPKILWFLQERFHFLVRLPNSFGWLLPNLVSSVFFGWPKSPNLVIWVTRITE